MGEKMFLYLDRKDRKWSMRDLELGRETIEATPIRKNAIEGTFLMKNEQILEWSELLNRCIECLNQLDYNEEHDSEFCSTCDEWREESCIDPDCEYCLARPEKPSSCKKTK